jgi:predicted metal-dependent enzyme (double-stranded beta helix superfamily)
MTTSCTTRRTRTTWTVTGAALLALAATALLAMGGSPSGADEKPDPITAEPLTQRHTFADDVAVQVRDKPDGRSTDVVNLRDASNIAVVEITIQPGAQFPWHIHPGPVLATVVEGDDEGAFVFVYGDDCVERPYEVGEAFVDPGDSVHMAYNPSADEETVVIATFLGVPAEGELTQPVDETEGVDLDRRCGIDRRATLGEADGRSTDHGH